MKKILFLFCIITANLNLFCQNEYPLYANRIGDFVYVADHDIYYIVYTDTTIYPMLQRNEEVFTTISCTREIFFDYLEKFKTIKECQDDSLYMEDDVYLIKETITRINNRIRHNYSLSKKTDNQRVSEFYNQ